MQKKLLVESESGVPLSVHSIPDSLPALESLLGQVQSDSLSLVIFSDNPSPVPGSGCDHIYHDWMSLRRDASGLVSLLTLRPDNESRSDFVPVELCELLARFSTQTRGASCDE